MISVIIPTYKSPDALDICLRSAIAGQRKQNEIIVVVDGHYDINADVLKKYSEQVSVLDLKQNVGTCRATNLGVYNASNEAILIVNDDNVFPDGWDDTLMSLFNNESVISPNQIEPYDSMFRQFVIKDLGRNPYQFDLEKFWSYEKEIRRPETEECGSTFPIFISKYNFLRVGGFDDQYPSPSGFVADWEFFMKCEMSGLKMIRTYNTNFYHFVSVSAKSEEQIEKSREYEYNCHHYFKYKWGQFAEHNSETNSKLISKYRFSK